MLILKKLVFALPFLAFFYWFVFLLTPFFKDIYLIFNFNIEVLYKLIYLVVALGLASLFFVIFASLAQDWLVVLSVAFLAAISALVFLPTPVSFVLAGGFLVGFGLVFTSLRRKLLTYITFDAITLLHPSIKSLATVLILATSVGFYLTANLDIQTKGFSIPDAIIDSALKFSQPPQDLNVKGIKIAQTPTLTPEQIELLRQNPDLLRQYGIDPSILDSLDSSNAQQPANQPNSQHSSSTSTQQPSSQTTTPGTTQTPKITSPLGPSQDFVKKLVKSQLETMIKPYTSFIPAILAALLFFTLQSFFSIASILAPILIVLNFWILEKTGFVRFEREMREVKKLVV